jgi:hypothetical protein
MTAGARAAVCAALLSACSTTTPCSANLCDGCCDADGRCLAGTALVACGVKGAACHACQTGDTCLAGVCAAPSPCAKPEDCAAVHCVCGDSQTVDSRTCNGGHCGADCDSACLAAGHPRPGDVPDAGPAFSFCVAGTQSSCFGSDLTWLGGQCCVVVGYGQCTDGTAGSCFGPNLEWTGSTCCVKNGFGPCAPGTAQVCTGTGFAWTGVNCCVSDAYQLCTDGVASSCAVDGLVWTGSKCCAAAEYTQCVAGTAMGCQGTDMRWTGSQCCVKNRGTCADGSATSCSGAWTGSKCCP